MAEGAVERTTPCPRCGVTVGLTAAELEDKRGRCPACGGFELDQDSLLTDVAAPRPLALDRLPDRAIVRSRRPLVVELASFDTSVGSLLLWIVAMVAGLPGLVWATHGLAIGFVLLAISALFIGLGAVAWPHPTQVTIEPGRLTRRRLLRRDAVLPLAGAVELARDPFVIVRSGGRTLTLGSGEGLADDDRAWLGEVLREAARGGGDGA